MKIKKKNQEKNGEEEKQQYRSKHKLAELERR